MIDATQVMSSPLYSAKPFGAAGDQLAGAIEIAGGVLDADDVRYFGQAQ
jgi:hypothetical protein